MTTRIAFICSGNICRSPMAEALASEILDDRGVPVALVSMGTLGIVGRPPSENAIRVLAEIGVELEGHRSQGVSPRLLEHAEYIVPMTPDHERFLRGELGDIDDQLVRLWEWTDHPHAQDGIPDPVGDDIETFRRCRDAIRDALEQWFDEL
ncbi:MAG: low molecular weight protein arginine phosphatase [Bradymonadaceae bacterium]